MLAYFGALGETQVATYVSAEVNILYIAIMDLIISIYLQNIVLGNNI